MLHGIYNTNKQFGYGEKDRAGDDKYGGGNFGGSGGSGTSGEGAMSMADDKYKDDYEGVNGAGADRNRGGGEEGGDDFGGSGGSLGRGNGGAGDALDDYRKQRTEAVDETVAKPACDGWKADYHVQPGIGWGTLPYELQEKWKAYDCDKYEYNW